MVVIIKGDKKKRKGKRIEQEIDNMKKNDKREKGLSLTSPPF
jgi:hypothetical protein